MGKAVVYCDACGSRITEKELERGKAITFRERYFCEDCKGKLEEKVRDKSGDSREKSTTEGSQHGSESLQDLVEETVEDEETAGGEEDVEGMWEDISEAQTKTAPSIYEKIRRNRWRLLSVGVLVLIALAGGRLWFSYRQSQIQKKKIRSDVRSDLNEVEKALLKDSREFDQLKKQLSAADQRLGELQNPGELKDELNQVRKQLISAENNWQEKKRTKRERLGKLRKRMIHAGRFQELKNTLNELQTFRSELAKSPLRDRFEKRIKKIARSQTKKWFQSRVPDELNTEKYSAVTEVVSAFQRNEKEGKKKLAEVEQLTDHELLDSSVLVSIRTMIKERRKNLRKQLRAFVREQYSTFRDQFEEAESRSVLKSLAESIAEVLDEIDYSISGELVKKYETLGKNVTTRWFQILQNNTRSKESLNSVQSILDRYKSVMDLGQHLALTSSLKSNIREQAHSHLSNWLKKELQRIPSFSKEPSLKQDIESYKRIRDQLDVVNENLKKMIRTYRVLFPEETRNAFRDRIGEMKEKQIQAFREVVLSERKQLENHVEENVNTVLSQLRSTPIKNANRRIRSFAKKFHPLSIDHPVRKQIEQEMEALKQKLDRAKEKLEQKLKERAKTIFHEGEGRENFIEEQVGEVKFRMEEEAFVIENRREGGSKHLMEYIPGGIWVGNSQWNDYILKLQYEVTSGSGFLVVLRSSGNLPDSVSGIWSPFSAGEGRVGISVDRKGTVEMKVRDQFMYYRIGDGRKWTRSHYTEEGERKYKWEPVSGKIFISPLSNTTMEIRKLVVIPLD